MIKAVLWDNDGTILESEELYRGVAMKVLKTFGVDLEHSVMDKFNALNMKDYYQAIIHHYDVKVTPEEMIKVDKEIFGESIPPRNQQV